jgi:hypothetical protein
MRVPQHPAYRPTALAGADDEQADAGGGVGQPD